MQITLLIYCCTVIFVAGGCSKTPTHTETNSSVKIVTFEEQRHSFLASQSESEAEARWDVLKESLDISSPAQIHQWLEIQQIILTNSVAIYSHESLRRSAIQEFFLLFEYAEPFRAWLEESKEHAVFKDPFIIDNINRVLDVLNKRNNKINPQ